MSFVGKETKLASFSMLGDVELVDKLSDKFAEELKDMDFDYLVATEMKIISLVHGIAKRLNHTKFVVCRKTVRPYMIRPIILKPLPHFPKHVKQVVINGTDAELLQGKKVVVIDDVLSTGVTMRMIHILMDQVGAIVVKKMVILKQGEQFDKIENLFFLENLPIFKTTIQTY